MSYIRSTMTGILAVGLTAGPALADGGYGNYGNYGFGGHMYDGGMHGYWLGPLMMIAFVIVAIVAVVLVVRWLGGERDSSGAGNRDAAADVLRDRYARGEIDDDEFKRRMETLSRHA